MTNEFLCNMLYYAGKGLGYIILVEPIWAAYIIRRIFIG